MTHSPQTLLQLAGIDIDPQDPTLTVTFWREEGNDNLQVDISPAANDKLKTDFARMVSDDTIAKMTVGTKYAIAMNFDKGCASSASPGGDTHDQRILATLQDSTRLGFIVPLETLGAVLRRLPTLEQFERGVQGLSRAMFERAALAGKHDLLATGQRSVKVICPCGDDHSDPSARRQANIGSIREIPGLGVMLEIAISASEPPDHVLQIPNVVPNSHTFFGFVGTILGRAAMNILERVEAVQLQNLSDQLTFAAAAINSRIARP